MKRHNKIIIVTTLFVALLALCVRSFCAEEIASTDIFVGGESGYAIYRIPALVVTAKGTILAFAEARKNGPADSGDIDLVVRRSFDNGATWEPQRLVFEDGAHTIGNPSPVVDRETGAIILTFNRDNTDVLVTRSEDDGATWSAPADITKDVTPAGWDWYAMGPGHAIQLRSGRLLVPCDHKEKNVQYSHVIFSDDGGKTWKPGGSLPKQTDEATAVELEDGSVMINMRNYYMRGMRAVAVSKDAGLTWSKIIFARDLIEPVCEGSILRYTAAKTNRVNRLLFSNPASRVREKMTVKISYDEGKTWPASKLINAGRSGYSDLVALPDLSVGIIYENGKKDYYEKITFARFTLNWLTDGKDKL
ncbi:MAG: sialidase family protein [bacterium]